MKDTRAKYAPCLRARTIRPYLLRGYGPSIPSTPIVLRAFFLGNWFYGVCAVALSIEAALQQQVPMPGPVVHGLLFCTTVLFYSHAYRRHAGGDERSIWYAQHHRAIATRQVVLGLLSVGLLTLALVQGAITWRQLPYLCIFPAIGLAYYGTGVYGLRRIGWLKPLVIGVVWAGVVTWHPAVLSGRAFPFFDTVGALLFLKNVLFVSLLGVLFDIKDHADDHRHALRTLVVQRGLRATLFRVVVPLVTAGLLLFLAFGIWRGFSWPKILLNVVPFAGFVALAFALRRKRSILFYLVVVDGLLLVKAVCGSVAMRWF